MTWLRHLSTWLRHFSTFDISQHFENDMTRHFSTHLCIFWHDWHFDTTQHFSRHLVIFDLTFSQHPYIDGNTVLWNWEVKNPTLILFKNKSFLSTFSKFEWPKFFLGNLAVMFVPLLSYITSIFIRSCVMNRRMNEQTDQVSARNEWKWLSWIIHKYVVLAQKYLMDDLKSCPATFNRLKTLPAGFPECFEVIRQVTSRFGQKSHNLLSGWS